jgi:hypothetical protein
MLVAKQLIFNIDEIANDSKKDKLLPNQLLKININAINSLIQRVLQKYLHTNESLMKKV